MNNNGRAQWSGKLAFILAASGSAIGLGNIWKFPYIAGVNGGGAFVLVYLVCVGLVGIPIMLSELYIGQTAQKNAVESFEALDKKNTPWRLPGWMGLLSAFLILSFYSVVGGWILDFEFKSVTSQLLSQDEGAIKAVLTELFQNPLRQVFWHTLFMVLTCSIVLMGVKKGLERWNKILMPTLLAILVLLLVRVMFTDGFSKALSFLFALNFENLNAESVLEAVGHSFFTLSLGMGAILTYGSYLSKKESLQRITLAVAIMDTVIALVAGLVIFSIVFTFDLEPNGGPGLIFSTLPVLFAKMPGGYFISSAFFLLVAFAAFTSSVSILEVTVAYWVEKHDVDRKKATIAISVVIYLVGLLSVFSTNILGDFKVLGYTFFDLFDKLTTNFLLPIGGMLISMFFGWKLGEKAALVICHKKNMRYHLLMFTTRYLAPLAVGIIVLWKIWPK